MDKALKIKTDFIKVNTSLKTSLAILNYQGISSML